MDETNVCFAETQKPDVNDVNRELFINTENSSPIRTRICLVGDVCNDSKTYQAAQKFGMPVVLSKNGREFLNDGKCDTIFVTNEFSGPVFEAIHKSEQRILGPTALQEYSERGEDLPSNSRPLYCQAMLGMVICFTGFRKKDELNRMINVIHHMGGSIRKDMVSKVTHLIASGCTGEKYRYAATFNVPVMTEAWVFSCWEKRNEVGFSATSDEMMNLKLKPFFGSHVCFYGFPEEEKEHLTEVLLQNGGEVAELDDPSCTHVVADGAEKYSTLKAQMVVTKTYPASTPNNSVQQNSLLKCDNGLNNSSICSTVHLFSSPPDCSTPISKLSNSTIQIVEDNNVSVDFVADNESLIEKAVLPLCQSDSYKPLSEFNTTPVTSFPEKNILNNKSRISGSKRSLPMPELTLTPDSFVPDKKIPKFESDENFKTPQSFKNRLNSISEPSKSASRRLSYDVKAEESCFLADVRSNKPRKSCPPLKKSNHLSPKSCGHPSVLEEELPLTMPVVDENVPEATITAPVVKVAWFWTSVQNEARADEKEHLFEDNPDASQSPAWYSSQGTPVSTRARKRKRLRDMASQITFKDSPGVHKRRSSISEATLLSLSGSFLDSSASPGETDGVESVIKKETPRKNQSPRHQVFLELVQTESNYVGILHTIMTLFKCPLEDTSVPGGALLNNTELKIIFGNLPPIYDVHKQMLEEFKWAATHWKEDCSIGKIFLKYAPDLIKAYPPFVNFFENTKEMLVSCDLTKPRFHAFLKICQTKPECGRQSLQELLIRPVQRLPSISLLLSDILKHTPKNNPDHSALDKALSSIREVMTHINEDKRKTEGQLVMFDIFNEIDNCPPHLVSSHRSFIVRCDVVELSDGLSGRGDNLVLFLFSDTMEVCKKRSRTFNSLKSPNTTSSLHSVKLSSTKPYKHVRLIPLSTIKSVINIRETDDCHNVFALMCRSNQELKEKLYSFTIADEETEKLSFLRTLCRQMANTVCKTDAENFLTSYDSHQLDIDTSDVALGTLSKAFKFATRTRMKVGRAFSFNKTPSKLKRAMSTMMSPFGSTTNLTPASQLAQMRLASCNNLNELGSSPAKEEPSYVAPLSVQPTRKNKCSSLNISLRRL